MKKNFRCVLIRDTISEKIFLSIRERRPPPPLGYLVNSHLICTVSVTFTMTLWTYFQVSHIFEKFCYSLRNFVAINFHVFHCSLCVQLLAEEKRFQSVDEITVNETKQLSVIHKEWSGGARSVIVTSKETYTATWVQILDNALKNGLNQIILYPTKVKSWADQSRRRKTLNSKLLNSA